jgi:hypothetical protein
MNKSTPKGRWICCDCGSEDVQVMAWVNPNTGEMFEIISEGASEVYYAWCPDCEDEVDFEWKPYA